MAGTLHFTYSDLMNDVIAKSLHETGYYMEWTVGSLNKTLLYMANLTPLAILLSFT